MTDEKPGNIVICIPVFNDWESVEELIRRLDRVAEQWPFQADLLLVDDGSTDPVPLRMDFRLKSLRSVEMLRLLRNLGHQRAIAIALTFIRENRPCRAVVVMDGDGEDAPDDIIKLINRLDECHDMRVVFAKRSRRTEGIIFGLLYRLYKVLHLILTGIRVEVGNFSVVPMEHLNRLVSVSEMWNHYAASVLKARIPIAVVPIDRARRIAGKSKMNFVSLVAHGLSAMAVFAEIVGVRLLVSTCALIAVAVGSLSLVVVFQLGLGRLIPGWITWAALGSVFVLFQGFALSFVFVFIALHGRSGVSFLPIRDYGHFVREILPVRFES